MLTSLVEEGLGYTLLPPSSVRHEVASGRLETAAIAKPAPMRELTLASPIDHPGSTAITLRDRASPRRTHRLPRRGPLGHQARLSRCQGLTDWLRTKRPGRHSHLATAVMPQLYRAAGWPERWHYRPEAV